MVEGNNSGNSSEKPGFFDFIGDAAGTISRAGQSILSLPFEIAGDVKANLFPGKESVPGPAPDSPLSPPVLPSEISPTDASVPGQSSIADPGGFFNDAVPTVNSFADMGIGNFADMGIGSKSPGKIGAPVTGKTMMDYITNLPKAGITALLDVTGLKSDSSIDEAAVIAYGKENYAMTDADITAYRSDPEAWRIRKAALAGEMRAKGKQGGILGGALGLDNISDTDLVIMSILYGIWQAGEQAEFAEKNLRNQQEFQSSENEKTRSHQAEQAAANREAERALAELRVGKPGGAIRTPSRGGLRA